jgi:hypothetical protein
MFALHGFNVQEAKNCCRKVRGSAYSKLNCHVGVGGEGRSPARLVLLNTSFFFPPLIPSLPHLPIPSLPSLHSSPCTFHPFFFFILLPPLLPVPPPPLHLYSVCIFLPVWLSMRLSVCFSSVYLSFFPAYLSVCLSVFLCLYKCTLKC